VSRIWGREGGSQVRHIRKHYTETSSEQPVCTQHTSGTGGCITIRLNVKV